MRKSSSSIATLRSRLRTTHAVLEELVIIKVAAYGVRERAVLKAISILKDNALLGDEKIFVSPGLLRLHSTLTNPAHVDDQLSLLALPSVSSYARVNDRTSASMKKAA
jgi:hypothetical protein